MRVAILGVGRMGGWLAGQLVPDHRVALLDRDPARAGAVEGALALERSAQLAGFGPELLVNAVPLAATVQAFEEALPHLPADCVLADLASVKGELPAWYARCGFRFASVHPMFGPTFGDLERLREENAIVIRESDPRGAALFRGLFERLGLTVFEYSFAEHDRMMAYSLSTPFACSLAFAAGIDQSVVPGTTFARHLQIARGLLTEDDDLLLHILFDNRHSGPQLARLAENLSRLRELIETGDTDGARRLLARLRRNVG
jgi:prephenate dehydrogenase